MRDTWDDERLLGALREAISARDALPEAFVAAAKSAYAWRTIDFELARLTYDSSRDEDRAASLRTETASIRALTFTSSHLSIELEITEDSLIGQIIPPQEGVIDAQTKVGEETVTRIDHIGCFCIYPLPASAFRLHCRTDDGTDVVTGWITL